MKPIRLVSGFLTVGLWTLASRLMGFVRDIMIAAYLGTGPVAEAFLIAFSLPNMFRRFFAEGAFNMAFVPMFSKKFEAGEDAEKFANDAFTGLATVLIVFTVIAMAAMPWLVLAMASGFAGDERFDLAVDYGRIAFPYILFISLAALLSGVLNSIGRFTAAAAAPVLLNVLFIAGMVLGHALGWPVGDTLVWTVPLAGFAQMALVWYAAHKAGFTLRFTRPKFTPELKRLAIIAAPAALSGGVVQVNLLIGRQIASFFDGAVAWLSYADRLYQLPLGVVGIAIGVVLLPDLSRRLRGGDIDGSRDAFNRACEMSLALTVPAAVALMVIPVPLVQVLFERGAFGSDDTMNTAIAVAVYGLGLPAFVMQKTLQPLFFAREDTRRPFYIALASLAITTTAAIGLAPFIGFIASAIATTLSAWVAVLILWIMSRPMGEAAQFDARFKRRIWRIVLASFAMGAVLWFSYGSAAFFFGLPHVRYLALFILVMIGMVSYFIVGQLIGAFRIREFAGAFRRSR
ncbi:murein biosynthesis integral membrane protein MurJ [Marivivens aquimaris]|uniref:murein biosynthesis integral membrane protein MurJ n=1 Tax=Marivivens aquimaris TaxID=2774876 RepID=UPI00188143A6|nr:murein biosynthesis integral membrane protein MurJ [Marivivens aquimaris]